MSTKLFAVSSLLLLAQIYGIFSHPQPDSSDQNNYHDDQHNTHFNEEQQVYHPYDKIKLSCKHGSSEVISWSYNDSQLPNHVQTSNDIEDGDNSHLIIPSANFSDSGTYECKSGETLLQKYSIKIRANNSISLRGSSTTKNCSFTCNVTNYAWSSKGSNDKEDQFNCTSKNDYSKTNLTFYVKIASELKDQAEVLDCEYTDVENKGTKFVINASSNLSSIEVRQTGILDGTYTCKKVSSGTANLCASFTIILGLIAFVFVKNN